MCIPNYIIGADNDNLNTNLEICVHLNEAEIWQPNVFANDILDSVANTIIFEVDSEPVERETISVIQPLHIITAKNDGENNLIGTYGAGISVCIPSVDISEGVHDASITFYRIRISGYLLHNLFLN